jgi:hypothetical protein
LPWDTPPLHVYDTAQQLQIEKILKLVLLKNGASVFPHIILRA